MVATPRTVVHHESKGRFVSRGFFVWHDLMTSDAGIAVPFYRDLLGWIPEQRDMGDMSYTMLKAGDVYIGGVTNLDSGNPHWVSYISVDDISAACKTITERGGRILQEPFTVEGVGQMAYAADPNGAVFAPFQDTTGYQPEVPHGVQPPGAVAWHEVTTPDQKATDDFYAAIFGWGTQIWPMGEYEYHGLTIGDAPVAGVFKAPDGIPSAWTIYFEAPAKIDDVLDNLRALGGTVLQDKFTVEGTGDIAVVADPTGAVFGLMKSEPMGEQ
jgi:predicted enzyme related to lactoylglutathione lyase